jgi:threonine dehydratase
MNVLDQFSAERLAATHARIAPWVRRTPTERSWELSERVGFPVWLKLECWQVSGSFKPRISFAKLLALAPEVRQRGVVASTAGGHGVGLAYAAQALHVPCHVCIAAHADTLKRAWMGRYGADVTVYDDQPGAVAAAGRLAHEQGWTRVPAYDDTDVIAGDASVGLEIFEDNETVDAVLVGMGGGGLASGIGLAARALGRRVSVYGVQPAPVARLNRWLAAGDTLAPLEPGGTSIADGLGAAVDPQSITIPLLRALETVPLDVSDAEIVAAMQILLDMHQLLVEPSGAAPLAGLLRHADLLRRRNTRGVALVLTGRTIAAARRRQLLG